MDPDEADYYRREQARFRFFKKIEDNQSDGCDSLTQPVGDSETARGESLSEG